MEKIKAPWTQEMVNALNHWQQCDFTHPFTCCGDEGCKRSEREDDGILIATTEGWICPCGKYKQDWAHEMMSMKPVDWRDAFKDKYL